MWRDKCPVEKVDYWPLSSASFIVIVKNMFLLLLLCTTFQQLRAACSPGIQSVSPSGVVRASLNQPVTFACEVQGSGIFWYANNRHVSEGDNLALQLEESNTIVLDSMDCARQRNLTGIATSLANNISLTCLSLGIPMPSPQILLLVEGTAPVTICSNEDGYQPAVALSKLNNSSLTSVEEVKNYVKLKWDQPYTSDDPQTLKYDIKIVHIETNSTIKQVEVGKTELSIPAEELQHCCNYSVSVRAKTENFTANVSHTSIPCSGFPPSINTQNIRSHLSWIEDMATFSLTFTVDEIPDFSCPRQHPENVTIMALSLLTGKIVTVTSSISSMLPQTFQVNLIGLEKHQKFKSIVLLSNQVGHSTFNDTLSFTTFAVQGLITSIEGNEIVLTCTFMKGFQARSCHIELTHTASGKQDAISLYKNATPSATFSVQHNGRYNVSVYDIDDEGEVFSAKALTTVIWVESDNIQTAGPIATGHTPFPSSTTSPWPSTTVNPNTNHWELWLIVITGIIVLLVLVVSGCFLLAVFRKCVHRHKILKPSVRNTIFYCKENNYEFHTPTQV